MSTAGKVLAVLLMLMSLVWMILSAGVSQLNTNGNKKLHDLAEQVEKLQDDVEKAHDDVVALKSSAATIQEQLDHEIAMLYARQSDHEKDRSQIRESLARWQYQLATVQETIDRAKSALQHRTEEQQTGEQVLAKSKSDVKELMDRSGELMSQLDGLRKEFQATYHANIESLGKTR
jgi:chromosome segregation ATPase